MASIGWLHLTDLHLGLSGQKWLWPSVKEQFFADLERLHAKSGPWDLVLFTGDLTQMGTKEEFDRLTETLGRLWNHLAKLGSKPALVTVPGNHDTQRPKLSPTVRALRNWNSDPSLRDEFWAGADNEYRVVLNEAFGAYEGFAKEHPLPADFVVRQGVLPGDRSISLVRGGLKVALVGLNTAFLQLEGGDYQGKLDLDARQLHGVCGDDPPEWLGAHQVALLLTHHPTTWLSPRALSGFKADIAPPGRFVAHLFGHMHEGATTSISVSGTIPQRAVQGPSLFGLETWGDGSEQRIHGYMAGRITLDGDRGAFKLWPRELRKSRAGSWQMVPDASFDLRDEAAAEEFKALRGTTAQANSPTMSDPPTALRSPGAEGRGVSKLSGEQFRQLMEALGDAFPSRRDLARMVRIGLNENLDALASARNLNDTTFELITWAEARGQTVDLVAAARRANPGNPMLAALGMNPARPTESVSTAARPDVRVRLSVSWPYQPPHVMDNPVLIVELQNHSPNKVFGLRFKFERQDGRQIQPRFDALKAAIENADLDPGQSREWFVSGRSLFESFRESPVRNVLAIDAIDREYVGDLQDPDIAGIIESFNARIGIERDRLGR